MRTIKLGLTVGALVLALASCLSQDEVTSIGSEVFSCFDPLIQRVPAFSLSKRSNVSLKADSMVDAVRHLNDKFDLPISFIEGQDPGSSVEVVSVNLSVREVLRRIIESSPEYRCAVVDNRHMVIFGKVAGLHVQVDDVNISEMNRIRAAKAYLQKIANDHARNELPKNVLAAMGGLDGGELLSEKVSLSRRGTVLEHFVQLLGDSDDSYFAVYKKANGGRYMTFGEISAPPGGDLRRAQR